MARLPHRIRERLRDEHAKSEYYRMLRIIGDDPTPEQRLRLLALVAGWDVERLVAAVRREADGAETKPIIDRYLAVAAKRWPPPDDLGRAPRWTLVGPGSPAKDFQELNAEDRVFWGFDALSPAEPGFRFVSLPGHDVAVRVWEGAEPAIFVLPAKDASVSFYTPFLDYLRSADSVDQHFLSSLDAGAASAYEAGAQELRRRKLVVMDTPAKGYSDGFPDSDVPRTWFDLADVVHDVADEVGINEAPIVMAASGGGPPALAFHSRYGASGLLLLDIVHFAMAVTRGELRDAVPYNWWFDDNVPPTGKSTILDLRRAADELAGSKYREVPGVSFRCSPATRIPGFIDSSSFVTDWRHHGVQVADRLGLVAVTSGPHNLHFHSPELIRLGLLAIVAAQQAGKQRVRLDPAVVNRLGGRIENSAVMARAESTEPVDLTGVLRFPEEAALPRLPGRITDRVRQFDGLTRLSGVSLLPPKLDQGIPKPPEPSWLHDHLVPAGDWRQRWMRTLVAIPGTSLSVPGEVFPRVSATTVESIRSSSDAPGGRDLLPYDPVALRTEVASAFQRDGIQPPSPRQRRARSRD